MSYSNSDRRGRRSRLRGDSMQNKRDVAALHLVECVLNKKVLPEDLALQLCDFLDDPKRLVPRVRFLLDERCECRLTQARRRILVHLTANAYGLNATGIAGYEAAAKLEASFPPDGDSARTPLSSMSVAYIARKTKASRASIRKWRTWPQYWNDVQQYRYEPASTAAGWDVSGDHVDAPTKPYVEDPLKLGMTPDSLRALDKETLIALVLVQAEQIRVLTEQNTALQARVAALEAQLNAQSGKIAVAGTR